MKKRTILISLLFVGLLYSCGGDDAVDCMDTTALVNQVNTAVDISNDAATAYNNDPSDANCNNFKDALDDLIDALESFEDCANQTGQGQQVANDITQSRDARSQLPC